MKNFIKRYDLTYNTERIQSGVKDLYSYGTSIKSFMDATPGEEKLSEILGAKLQELLSLANAAEKLSEDLMDIIKYHSDNEQSWEGYTPKKSLRTLMKDFDQYKTPSVDNTMILLGNTTGCCTEQTPVGSCSDTPKSED